jgi:hypothetical protein
MAKIKPYIFNFKLWLLFLLDQYFINNLYKYSVKNIVEFKTL